MNKTMIALTGASLGAGVMYLSDPIDGKRRRAWLRDAVVHTAHTVQDAAGTASRDIGNRVAGLVARTASVLAPPSPPDDEVLAARVRARVGRLVSHPGAIDVKVMAGQVTMSGPLFESEVPQLIAGVAKVAGVTRIDNCMEPHPTASDIPSLQGRGPLNLDAASIRWTPTARVIAGVAGLALMALASRLRPTPEKAAA